MILEFNAFSVLRDIYNQYLNTTVSISTTQTEYIWSKALLKKVVNSYLRRGFSNAKL